MGRGGHMKVIFFGTSGYCLPVLEALKTSFDLKMIITRADKPVGRKKILTPSATKLWAIEHKIPVTNDLPAGKAGYSQIPACDLAIVSDYGLIIPEAIFNTPRFGTLNVHFSKLPDLRGPSPVQFTLLRGDAEAWVTIFKLESPPELQIKMDSGPILWQKSYPVKSDDTTQTLYSRLFQKAAKELPGVVQNYQKPENRNQKLIKQDHSAATFTRFLTKEDGFINWGLLQQALQGESLQSLSIHPKIQQEATATLKDLPVYQSASIPLYNFYRALTPWPGMWTIKDGKRMIVRNCHLEGEKLILEKIQFEGKTATTL